MIKQSFDVDLGEIKLGQTYNFTISVENTGDYALKVTQVAVGCGSCTKASMENANIPAKGVSHVNVSFTPGTIGKQTKFVILYFSGGNVKLEFKSEVI